LLGAAVALATGSASMQTAARSAMSRLGIGTPCWWSVAGATRRPAGTVRESLLFGERGKPGAVEPRIGGRGGLAPKSRLPLPAPVLPWIRTRAGSRVVIEARRRRPEPVEPAVAAEATEPADGELEELLERWRVAELLAQIPAEEATLLRLRFYEGLSQTEIAE